MRFTPLLLCASHCPDVRITKLLIDDAENQVNDPRYFDPIRQSVTCHRDVLVRKVARYPISVVTHSEEQNRFVYAEKLRNNLSCRFLELSPTLSDEEIKSSYFFSYLAIRDSHDSWFH